VYKRQFYHIVEWNRIEKSIRQRESNRIIIFPESECSSCNRASQPTLQYAVCFNYILVLLMSQ